MPCQVLAFKLSINRAKSCLVRVGRARHSGGDIEFRDQRLRAAAVMRLSMKELRIGHKKNEGFIFGKTNPIRAEEGSIKGPR
jgi:hypothetical protein